jgi:hypothetical protein
MAEATEKLLATADAQYWATVVEGVLLLLTVVFTGWATVAASSATRAARTSVEVTEKTANRELRAYVGAHANYIFRFDLEHPVEVRFAISNFGQTPALKIRSKGLVRVCTHPLPAEFVFPIPSLPPPKEDLAGSSSVLFPQAPFSIVVGPDLPTSNEEIEAAIVGVEKRIYIFARVEYEDIFEKSHLTTICVSVVGGPNLRKVSQGVEVPSGGISFQSAARFNEAT